MKPTPMEHSPAPFVVFARGKRMKKKFFSVVIVRSIEETVEIVVEAKDAGDAHHASLEHVRARGDEYAWSTPRTDLTVWHQREIETPAIIDVTA
jgi:hypothetical protein